MLFDRRRWLYDDFMMRRFFRDYRLSKYFFDRSVLDAFLDRSRFGNVLGNRFWLDRSLVRFHDWSRLDGPRGS